MLEELGAVHDRPRHDLVRIVAALGRLVEEIDVDVDLGLAPGAPAVERQERLAHEARRIAVALVERRVRPRAIVIAAVVAAAREGERREQYC